MVALIITGAIVKTYGDYVRAQLQGAVFIGLLTHDTYS